MDNQKPSFFEKSGKMDQIMGALERNFGGICRTLLIVLSTLVVVAVFYHVVVYDVEDRCDDALALSHNSMASVDGILQQECITVLESGGSLLPLHDRMNQGNRERSIETLADSIKELKRAVDRLDAIQRRVEATP